MVKNLRTEAEALSKTIVEDAQVVAQQEFLRMKEKITTETVEEAVLQASKVLQEKMDKSQDEAAIKKQLEGVGKN